MNRFKVLNIWLVYYEKFDAENVESNGGHLVTSHTNIYVLLNCRLMLNIDGSF